MHQQFLISPSTPSNKFNMGRAKKGTKNFNKAARKIGAKTFERRKKSHQIKKGNEVKASKKAARDAAASQQEKPPSKRSTIDAIECVDDLLASDIFGGSDDEDEELVEDRLGSLGADEEEEDAGTSTSGRGSEEQAEGGGVGQEELAEEDSIAQHQHQLDELREKDPSFFEFLLENDADLLNFAQEDAGGMEGEDEEFGRDEGEDPPVVEGADGEKQPPTRAERLQGGTLTMERWELLANEAGTKRSFPALRAVVGAFRSVVQSLAGEREAAAVASPKEGEGDKKRAKKQAKKFRKQPQKRGVFAVEDPAVCQAVMTWTAANMERLLDFHAKVPERAKVSDVTKTAKKWPRVQAIARIFFGESLAMLRATTSADTQTSLLSGLYRIGLQKFLFPFKKLRPMFLKTVSTLWSSAMDQAVRERAFLFLKNAAALPSHVMEPGVGKWRNCTVLLKMKPMFPHFGNFVEILGAWFGGVGGSGDSDGLVSVGRSVEKVVFRRRTVSLMVLRGDGVVK